MKDFKTFINENILIPRNIEGRKDKLKQMNIRLLSQEVIDGYIELDESFMDIDAKFVKIKKVNGDVWLNGGHWTEIPEWLKDLKIEGDFICSNNELISLEGCPEHIKGDFLCSNNELVSLQGCPKIIGGDFYCSSNKLSSLEGCPENVNGDFLCSYNELISLEGCPKIIGRGFYCDNNKVKLELPDYVKVKGKFKN